MKRKLQILSLALVFLMPATLTYAQSENPGDVAAATPSSNVLTGIPADYIQWEAGQAVGGTAVSVAKCPPNFTVVAGGDHYNVYAPGENTGYPVFAPANEWVAVPPHGTIVQAYVACVSPKIASQFEWVPQNTTHEGYFGAHCPSGMHEITGWAPGTERQWGYWTGALFDTYWSTSNDVWVSCGSADLIDIIDNFQPNVNGAILTACPPGTGVLVGGTSGDFDYSGPARFEYPAGISDTHTATAFWVDSPDEHIFAQIACAPTS